MHYAPPASGHGTVAPHSTSPRAPRGSAPRFTPTCGMTVAFTAAASAMLAGVPAHISTVWPRLASGDYLVTVTYARPIAVRSVLLTHIDALVSDLEPLPPTLAT